MSAAPHAGPGGPTARPTARWWNGSFAALVVVLCFGALALGGASSKGPTYDEFGHITAGVAAGRFGDMRLQPENGLLPELLAALPALVAHAAFPSRDQECWRTSDVWELGSQFCRAPGNDATALLLRGRAMIVLLAMVLAFGVYAWSRRLFGPTGGLISVLCFALSPALRSHGALATSDLAATAGLLLGTALVARVLQRVTPGRVLLSGAGLGLALLCKHSALLLLPVAAVLAARALLSSRGLEAAGFGRAGCLRSRPARAGLLLGVAVVHAALAALVLWGAYGFRESAFAAPVPAASATAAGPPEFYFGGWPHIEAAARDPAGAERGGAALSTALSLHRHHLLPDAWLYGFAFVLVHSTDRASYLDGVVRYGPSPGFFPRAFLYKTPLGLLVILLLAAGALVAQRRSALLSDAAPLLVLVGVVWIAALGTRLNVGDRHLLPALAASLVLCGAAAHWLERAAERRPAAGTPPAPGTLLAPGTPPAPSSPRAPRIAAALLLLALPALALESLANWPDDLAFFNAAAGGPDDGWRHLVDSSLDWGQELPGLAAWLAARDAGAAPRAPVYLSYFGRDSPTAAGLQVTLLPCVPELAPDEPLAPLAGGTYCISATMLPGLYTPLPAPWSPADEQEWIAACDDMRALDASRTDRARFDAFVAQRGAAYWGRRTSDFKQLRFARLCASLRRRPPDAQIGHAILVWELSDAAVQAAVWGPPVELGLDPKPPGH